jgi:hypothetical protein
MTAKNAMLEWILRHLQIVGWPAVAYAAFRIGQFFADLKLRASSLEQQITKLIANDIPHIETALGSLVQAIVDLRQELRDFLVSR